MTGICAGCGVINEPCHAHCPETLRTEIYRLEAEVERLRAALRCGVRAAKLGLFVINKKGVMPNASWKAGFDKDLAVAEAAITLSQETLRPLGPEFEAVWEANTDKLYEP